MSARYLAQIDSVWRWPQRARHHISDKKNSFILLRLLYAARAGYDYVMTARSVRDLGIYLDADASMTTHVTKSTSSCLQPCARSVLYGDLSQDQSCCRWSSLWSCHDWTMATPRQPAHQAICSTSCSLSWTLLHVWSSRNGGSRA